MSRNVFNLKAFFFLTIFLLGTAIFIGPSCKKDRSMTLTIVAKNLSDTTILVPDAKVVLDKGSIHVEGYTDSKGEFRHTFNLQIQLDVTVTKDTLAGIGIVNIGTLGVDVEKSIYVF